MIEGLIYMILHGIIIGVLVSAPMGPVGIFCIQRTLDKGRRVGLDTGIGAALSDLSYCLLTGFGLSFIEEFIQRNRLPIQLFGSAVLILFGIYLFRKKPVRPFNRDAGLDPPSRGGNILKGFLFTFSNPLILFLIIGLFAQFNFVIEGMRFYHYVLGFVSIFAGALGWWWLVTFFVDKLRAHFNVRSMWLINRVIGIIILIFAAFGIYVSIAEAKAAEMTAPPLAHVAAKGAVCTFRLEDRHADPRKKYAVADAPDAEKVRMPGWHIVVADSVGRGFDIVVSSSETKDPVGGNGMHRVDVRVSDLTSGAGLASASVSEGIDPYMGKNSWRLARDGDEWTLSGGNREWRHVVSFRYPCEGSLTPLIEANPGGEVLVSDLEMLCAETKMSGAYPGAEDMIPVWMSGGEGIEGVYSLFDYDVDDSLAPLGGHYRLAVVKNETENGAYDLVYLGGAVKLVHEWASGDLKGHVRKSGFVNIYDAQWVDAEGRLMANDIRAEYDPLTSTLTFQFPYQNTSLRFRKEK